MNSKIKIMHIRDSSGIYGAERVILTLAKNINKSNVWFGLICLRRKDGRSERLINSAKMVGINVFPVDVERRIDLKAIFDMREVLKKQKIDIIHTHDFKSDLYGLFATIGRSVKRVATAHGSTRDSLKKKIYLFFTEKGTYRFFNKIITVSNDLFDSLTTSGLPVSKIETIQNGMDFTLLDIEPNIKESPLPELKGTIVFSVIGRLFPDKGHKIFIEAFKEVQITHRNIRAMIVGDGPEKKSITQHVDKLGLTDFVHICGVRHNMAKVYKNTQCLIISSFTEGLPYVLLEAMANSVPVIATAVGDIPLLLREGETGYLVKPGKVDELVKKMVSYITRPSTAQKLAIAANRLVLERFSARSMATKTELLYQALMNKF